MGFQSEGEARETLADLKERFGRFGLALNEDKTRLIRFGRFAVTDSWKDGSRRPQTFNVLGSARKGATPRRSRSTSAPWRSARRRWAPTNRRRDHPLNNLAGLYYAQGRTPRRSRSTSVRWRSLRRRWPRPPPRLDDSNQLSNPGEKRPSSMISPVHHYALTT